MSHADSAEGAEGLCKCDEMTFRIKTFRVTSGDVTIKNLSTILLREITFHNSLYHCIVTNEYTSPDNDP